VQNTRRTGASVLALDSVVFALYLYSHNFVHGFFLRAVAWHQNPQLLA
jgi:hypothetical protein